MRNETKNIRTLMPRAPKGIVVEKKALKEGLDEYLGRNGATMGEYKQFLMDAIDIAERYDDDEKLEVVGNTYYVSAPYIGTYGGFISIKHPTGSDDDFDESLKEDFEYASEEVTTDVTPEPGPDMGVANLLINLINDEWEAIQGYNDFIATISAEGGFDDMLASIQDIVSEENVHVGQLQKLLQQISPDALKIAQGESEAQEQLDGKDEPEKIEEPAISDKI